MSIVTDDDIVARWTRAGALFMVPPAPSSPDLERLLLDTARLMSGNSRLFLVAVPWLARYGGRVDPKRLADRVRAELEPEHQPGLGLLLESVHQLSGETRFAAAVAACSPAKTPGPLFATERTTDVTRRIAERRASALSRKWGVWAAEAEPKYGAIRPEAWVDAHNPSYRSVPAEPVTR